MFLFVCCYIVCSYSHVPIRMFLFECSSSYVLIRMLLYRMFLFVRPIRMFLFECSYSYVPIRMLLFINFHLCVTVREFKYVCIFRVSLFVSEYWRQYSNTPMYEDKAPAWQFIPPFWTIDHASSTSYDKIINNNIQLLIYSIM